MSFHVGDLLPFRNFVASAHTDMHRSHRITDRNPLSRLTLFLTVSLLLTLSGHGAAQTAEPPSDMSGPPHSINTVFVIIMENHNWTGGGIKSIKQNELAPYINDTLIPMSSHAANYFNPPRLHPSLPNYLWLEAGTNFGIRDDAGPPVHHLSTHEHLVALLEKKGISWRAYEERAPGNICAYQFWHSAFVFFDDVTGNNNRYSAKCIGHIRPFWELKYDLERNKAARYNFIVPNPCNSMHSICDGKNQIVQGDQWLANTVPMILNSSAYRKDGVLFILWDEADWGDGPIPLIVLSPLAKGNGYSNKTYYTHGSLLRTIEEIFGVTPLLGDAAKQRDLRDLFIQFP